MYFALSDRPDITRDVETSVNFQNDPTTSSSNLVVLRICEIHDKMPGATLR